MSEGDFLRRSEIATTRRRPKWLEFIVEPGRLADEYVHASGRKVSEVMTPSPYTVGEHDSLEVVVELMAKHRIMPLPAIRDGRMVGIVSRANLMHALATITRSTAPTAGDDVAIRDRFLPLWPSSIGPSPSIS